MDVNQGIEVLNALRVSVAEHYVLYRLFKARIRCRIFAIHLEKIKLFFCTVICVPRIKLR